MAKTVKQLRRKLGQKSVEAEMFKNKYTKVLAENEKLKDELVKANERKGFSIPFIEETKSELFSVEEAVEKESDGFSSRFMPDVKFKVPLDLIEKLNSIGASHWWAYATTVHNGSALMGSDRQVSFEKWACEEVSIYEAIPEWVPKGMVYDKSSDLLVKKVCVNPMCQGEFCDCDDSHSFTSDSGSSSIGLGFTRIVTCVDSVYAKALSEANPDVVVECLCDDNTFEKFIGGKKVTKVEDIVRKEIKTLIVEPLIAKFKNEDLEKATIKSFAGELSRATPFSIDTCLSVIEDYGEVNARTVLDMMANDIDPSGFRLSEVNDELS